LLQHSNEDPLEAGQSGYTIINTMDCKINVHGDPSPFFEGNVPPFGVSYILSGVTPSQHNICDKLICRIKKGYGFLHVAPKGGLRVLPFLIIRDLH